MEKDSKRAPKSLIKRRFQMRIARDRKSPIASTMRKKWKHPKIDFRLMSPAKSYNEEY